MAVRRRPMLSVVRRRPRLMAGVDRGLGTHVPGTVLKPRSIVKNKGLVLEQGTILPAMQPALEKMGHKVSVGRLGLKANAAERTATGWIGAADPRGVGNALGE